MEQECKYRLREADYEALLRDPAILGILEAPLRSVHLAAVYYDTPEAALYARGISLRLRQENGVHVVCVKSKPSKAADTDSALKVRQEHECEADSPEAAFPMLEEKLDPAAADALREALPRLEIIGKLEYTRQTALLRIPGTDTAAHLCLDAGCFGSEPFWELELELASGDLAPLPVYAEALAGRYGLEPETRSKQGRAVAAWKKV